MPRVTDLPIALQIVQTVLMHTLSTEVPRELTRGSVWFFMDQIWTYWQHHRRPHGLMGLTLFVMMFQTAKGFVNPSFNALFFTFGAIFARLLETDGCGEVDDLFRKLFGFAGCTRGSMKGKVISMLMVKVLWSTFTTPDSPPDIMSICIMSKFNYIVLIGLDVDVTDFTEFRQTALDICVAILKCYHNDDLPIIQFAIDFADEHQIDTPELDSTTESMPDSPRPVSPLPVPSHASAPSEAEAPASTRRRPTRRHILK